MTLLVCIECTTKYAVGLTACPHCRTPHSYEEGDRNMPKISKYVGPTIEGDPQLSPEVVAEGGQSDESTGGEQQSVGTSSEPLSESPSQTGEQPNPDQPSPVPETENPTPSLSLEPDTAGSVDTSHSEGEGIEEPAKRTTRTRR